MPDCDALSWSGIIVHTGRRATPEPGTATATELSWIAAVDGFRHIILYSPAIQQRRRSVATGCWIDKGTNNDENANCLVEHITAPDIAGLGGFAGIRWRPGDADAGSAR